MEDRVSFGTELSIKMITNQVHEGDNALAFRVMRGARVFPGGAVHTVAEQRIPIF